MSLTEGPISVFQMCVPTAENPTGFTAVAPTLLSSPGEPRWPCPALHPFPVHCWPQGVSLRSCLRRGHSSAGITTTPSHGTPCLALSERRQRGVGEGRALPTAGQGHLASRSFHPHVPVLSLQGTVHTDEGTEAAQAASFLGGEASKMGPQNKPTQVPLHFPLPPVETPARSWGQCSTHPTQDTQELPHLGSHP